MPFIPPAAQISFVLGAVFKRGTYSPRKAVEDANSPVTAAMKQIDETFRYQRSQIEKQMTKGNASAEDMRVALQQYRALLDRLLSF